MTLMDDDIRPPEQPSQTFRDLVRREMLERFGKCECPICRHSRKLFPRDRDRGMGVTLADVAETA
jgi:hypothetical protein